MRFLLIPALLSLTLTTPGPAHHNLGPTPTPTPLQPPAPDPAAVESPVIEAAVWLMEADQRFSNRSVGAIDEVASKTEVDAAIALYRKAAAVSPRDIETLSKLLRALHFRGAYAGASVEEKKTIFDEGRRLGQDAVDLLETEAKAARGLSRVEALRLVKGAPSLYLWTAAHWGEWALVKGKFAAARSGIAGRLRDLSQTVIDLDPAFEDAAGYRLLGRLHSEAPKIPFITGWVSHEKGVQFLRRAFRIAPNHPVTWYFLAEAILDHEPANRDEALSFLNRCATTAPRSEAVLEDSRYGSQARKQLSRLRSTSGQ